MIHDLLRQGADLFVTGVQNVDVDIGIGKDGGESEERVAEWMSYLLEEVILGRILVKSELK